MRFDSLEVTKRQGDEAARFVEPRVHRLGSQLLLLNLAGKYNSDEYNRIKEQFNSLKIEYLIGKNIRLLFTIAQKYNNLNEYYPDIVSEGFVGFMSAVKTFDPFKNKRIKDINSLNADSLNKALSTHIGTCVENQIKMYARKLKRHAGEVSMNTPIAIDKEGNEITYEEVLESPQTIEQEVFEKIFMSKIDSVISQLPLRLRTIAVERISLRGTVMTSQQDLADKLGVSRSYVNRLEKKAEEIIKECLKKSGDLDNGK